MAAGLTADHARDGRYRAGDSHACACRSVPLPAVGRTIDGISAASAAPQVKAKEAAPARTAALGCLTRPLVRDRPARRNAPRGATGRVASVGRRTRQGCATSA
ncbi:hypothetical protein C7S16_1776 [Burkholderia thailandensis]|uniref:Uncharacterized protein n=1 Tax=Burkholderia thailandensis TaxID=57975 RepID=A0AAW9D588_BURTH|nr:hypothetical protein [Burkholderia thailandensis]MDW9257149.1 hypothetical protein [Burkholderia thailandensis]